MTIYYEIGQMAFCTMLNMFTSANITLLSLDTINNMYSEQFCQSHTEVRLKCACQKYRTIQ
jgi:hypothetical protein